jgi:3-hydroxybutyryl-CoA dehydrogenase
LKSTSIKKVTIIGAGTMGEGIAQVFAQKGMQVWLVDQHVDILNKCQAHIKANLEMFHEYQLIHEATSAIAARITPTTNLRDALTDPEFVVETISEVLEIKKQLYSELDDLPADVIIASNTSSIPITQITEDMKSSQRVIGVHYFNPPHIMPLVEIHRGQNTADEIFETTYQLMLSVGKKPILVRKVVPGFIVNRITGAMMREIYHLLEEGIVSPEDLDTAIKSSTGFKQAWIGPMELEDMAGLDTAVRVHARTYPTLDSSIAPSQLLVQKVNNNELGVKTGKGWLDYGGKTKEELMDRTNRMLLQQLVIFKSRDNIKT